jgi:penicillin-binding protein 2
VPRNGGLRLIVLRVLVLSLLATLGARLYYLQILDKDKLVQTANRQHTRDIILPAPRGAIVDDRGRPLVSNRVSLVVSVNRAELLATEDEGKSTLDKLAPLVRIPAAELARRITPCAKGVPKPCWNGSPYQPVPILTDTTPQLVLRIAEHREDFPGVTAEAQTLRQYPNRALAAHSLGYVGPVTQEELDTAAAAGTDLNNTDLVGRTGLENTYDRDLRGKDGTRQVSVDNRGTVTGLLGETAPTTGNTLVTSIDRDVQSLAEKALAEEIALRRTQNDPFNNHAKFAAPSGAAVVLDPRTGRIIALASYPTYDPTVFVGGISQKELAALTNPGAGTPLVSRAVQGQFAPGSTFKLSSASAELMSGRASLAGKYGCPGSLQVGNQTKTNFEGEAIGGNIDFRTALAKSCDTFFYGFAMTDWYSDQGRVDNGQKPVETLQAMARQYGFGAEPDIDLPAGEQTSGRIVDRAYLKARWDAQKKQYCANGQRGYPDVADPVRRDFLTRLARENCTDGWRFRIGDAADMSIGQGETTVSPLQLAMAYGALVNGGKLYRPSLGKAIVGPDGRVVRQLAPKVARRVPVSGQVLDYIRNSLAFTPENGASGSVAFTGFPLDKVLVGGKTGTAEVFGKQDTSWFASWAPAGPAGKAQYVVVAMVEQAGLGSAAAAPVARKIYEGLYGLTGHKPVLPGARPPAGLPKPATLRSGFAGAATALDNGLGGTDLGTAGSGAGGPGTELGGTGVSGAGTGGLGVPPELPPAEPVNPGSRRGPP